MSIRIRLCRFRTKFYALRYGGGDEHGTGYEWLGIRVEVGRRYERDR